MRSVARVLYEDQAKQVKDFGPHTLVLACFADDLGQSRWDLKHIVPGIPRKGDNKLTLCKVDDKWRLLSASQLKK